MQIIPVLAAADNIKQGLPLQVCTYGHSKEQGLKIPATSNFSALAGRGAKAKLPN